MTQLTRSTQADPNERHDRNVFLNPGTGATESAKQPAITDLNDSLCARALKHRVGRALPFDEIARARTKLVEEENVRGGVVVVVTPTWGPRPGVLRY